MSARPGRTAAKYFRIGIFSRRQVSTMDRMAATFGPACWLPTWIQFFRPRATGRIERQVVAQFQLGMLQEARELPPERKCVVRRLAQRAGRQGCVASCLGLHADYLQQWLGPLQPQRMARGVIEVLFARQGVDPEQLV